MVYGAIDKKGGLLARWGKQQWKITQSHVKALADASLAAEYTTTGTGKKQKKKLSTKATVSYPVYKSLMPKVDIAAEIWTWRSLIKKKYVLYIGGVAFGGYKKYQLISVDVSDVELVSGQIVHCEIELTFEALKKSYSLKKYKRVKKKIAKKSTKKKKKNKSKKKKK